MVGLVIVSHSRALADALLELIRQVSPQELKIAVAAGVGPERKEFGTDALEINEAIQAVYSPDGVLVLMDLGSAVMSAEIAVDLLPEEMRQVVRFSPAALVEGAIAAGVQAGIGSSLDDIYAEAQKALQPKIEHLASSGLETGEPAPAVVETPMETPAGPAQEVLLTLKNAYGLHARPAARFVQTAARFQSDIQVTNMTKGKGPVSAKSLNALATLGAGYGDQIRVSASGSEANQALGALQRLVDEAFGETQPPPLPGPVTVAEPAIAPSSIVEGQAIQAIPISEGVALGPYYRYQPLLPSIPTEKAENPDLEWDRLQHALETTQQEIRKRYQQMKAALGENDAAIFEAHLLILQDPELMADVHRRIIEDHENASQAWSQSIQQVARSYQSLEDPYLRQRANDVLDVGNQVLFALAGKAAGKLLEFPEPVILYAQDLTPTETSQLETGKIMALVTSSSGPTSHSAILARAMGIPSVSGVSPAIERLQPGTLLGVDGSTGTLWVNPPQRVQSELESQRKSWLEQRQQRLKAGRLPAVTRDGQRIEVVANVGSVADARLAAQNGAEGIGLLRTEFLYLARSTPPTESEQIDSLCQIGEAIGDLPVIVRTLDVGGDKNLPYLNTPVEANPFLGVRALRLSLRNPDVFLTQLRAILRAGSDYPFKIMFPMVANVDEVQEARRYLEQAHQMLLQENLPHRWPIEFGIMVEIPSAAILSPLIASHVDFFSIGTNDLTQYTLAAERGNPALSNLADAFHPAVLKLIKQVAEAAHQYGKWVGVCGELASDPLAAPVLVGLGVTELSSNAPEIPRLKEILRTIDMPEARQVAEQVLLAEGPVSARQVARELLI